MSRPGGDLLSLDSETERADMRLAGILSLTGFATGRYSNT